MLSCKNLRRTNGRRWSQTCVACARVKHARAHAACMRVPTCTTRMHACMRACVRACVRAACVRACVRACLRAGVPARTLIGTCKSTCNYDIRVCAYMDMRSHDPV